MSPSVTRNCEHAGSHAAHLVVAPYPGVALASLTPGLRRQIGEGEDLAWPLTVQPRHTPEVRQEPDSETMEPIL